MATTPVDPLRGPRKDRVMLAVLAAIPLVFSAFDFYQSVAHTGLYRRDWAGKVVKARPTVWGMVNLFEKSRRSEDHSNYGRYAATLETDDGQTLTVGLSRDEFYKTVIPSYLVCNNGSVRHFASREEAVAQHAVEANNVSP
jgi:hypothetical protein